jgi:hypothetical protein
MKTAWSHLPNAVHIDRVLASVKAHPEEWRAAWSAALSLAWDAAWADARDAAWSAAWADARDAAMSVALVAARDAAWKAAWNAAWDAARDATWNAALSAIAALIAWDDSALYLDMPSDQLKVWAILSEKPSAILLLPAVRAFEQIEEMELVA